MDQETADNICLEDVWILFEDKNQNKRLVVSWNPSVMDAIIEESNTLYKQGFEAKVAWTTPRAINRMRREMIKDHPFFYGQGFKAMNLHELYARYGIVEVRYECE